MSEDCKPVAVLENSTRTCLELISAGFMVVPIWSVDWKGICSSLGRGSKLQNGRKILLLLGCEDMGRVGLSRDVLCEVLEMRVLCNRC
jgi:hypothetical protein